MRIAARARRLTPTKREYPASAPRQHGRPGPERQPPSGEETFGAPQSDRTGALLVGRSRRRRRPPCQVRRPSQAGRQRRLRAGARRRRRHELGLRRVPSGGGARRAGGRDRGGRRRPPLRRDPGRSRWRRARERHAARGGGGRARRGRPHRRRPSRVPVRQRLRSRRDPPRGERLRCDRARDRLARPPARDRDPHRRCRRRAPPLRSVLGPRRSPAPRGGAVSRSHRRRHRRLGRRGSRRRGGNGACRAPLRAARDRGRDPRPDRGHRSRSGPAPAARLVDAHPVEALVDASRDAGLLVVGSRGLHGLRALGSVSERVAHSAACSVLVVRSRPQ